MNAPPSRLPKFTLLTAVTLSLGSTSLCGQEFSWSQSTAPIAHWQSVASSLNGSNLVAVVPYGGIYTSTNSGVSWRSANAPASYSWQSVASSSDGTNLVAAVFSGRIYTSTNAGNTWTPTSAPTTDWQSVASSADGSRLVAAVYDGHIYTSTNSGVTWTPASAPIATWRSVASSADGSKLAAAIYNGGIYTSTNGGITWTPSGAPTTLWQSVASSADGTKLAGVAYSVGIYTSSDSGLTWTPTSAGAQNWASIASSTDGTRLVGVAYGGGIYTSADSGGTWAPAAVATTNWVSVASSADGTKLVAVVYGGRISTAIVPCWISQQPESVLACPGSSHTFQITSGGTPPLNYRWRKNQTNLFDSGNITGSATTSLTLGNLSPGDTANYDLVVTNAYGKLTSSAATLTVTLKSATATLIVTNGYITGATLLDGGCGYSGAPAISFSGQGGSGATGFAQINNGTITNIVVTSAGHGYPTNALLLIAPPVFPSLRTAQGLFSPPTATAWPIISNGFVIGATVIGGGSGYTEAPSVSFSDVKGSGAEAYAQVSNGSVLKIIVTNAGSG